MTFESVTTGTVTSMSISPPEARPEIDHIQGTLRPTGYRLLVRIPELKAQMENWAGLHMPDDIRAREEAAQLTVQVIDLGPDAYRDKEKFPTGAWCKPGDFVVIRAYAGTRFTMKSPSGQEVLYALINDDTVQAVVDGGVMPEIGRS